MWHAPILGYDLLFVYYFVVLCIPKFTARVVYRLRCAQDVEHSTLLATLRNYLPVSNSVNNFWVKETLRDTTSSSCTLKYVPSCIQYRNVEEQINNSQLCHLPNTTLLHPLTIHEVVRDISNLDSSRVNNKTKKLFIDSH